jgi:hypothetical protein
LPVIRGAIIADSTIIFIGIFFREICEPAARIRKEASERAKGSFGGETLWP